jgi:serine/threonine protein phosphatase PrpC
MATATDIGGSAENQDRGIIIPMPDGTMLAVVADGHGPHGARAAQWAVEWLATHPDVSLAGAGAAETFAAIDEYIRSRLMIHLDVSGKRYMTFGRALYTPGFYGTRGLPIRGGTTLSIAAVGPDGGVRAAHVGDSDIHVFDDPAHGGDPNGVSLTGDHTPTSRAEYDRIRVTHPGAQFVCEASAVGLPASHDRPVWVPGANAGDPSVELNPAGPFFSTDVRDGWAAYLRTPDSGEGLAMTRALGDYNLQLMAGVSTVPHCQELPAMPPTVAGGQERVVIVASDGFWDIVHYAEVAEVIWRPENRGAAAAEATAAALMALAKAKTLERLGGPNDNITVSVVRVLAPPHGVRGQNLPALLEGPRSAAAAAEAPAVGGAGAASPAAAAAEAPAVGGAGAAAPAAGGHPLRDPVVWEAAVTGALPGVVFDSEDGMLPPLGRTPNTAQQGEGEDMLIRQGVRRGTGVLYFGSGNTQRVLYCSQSGEYWDIVYQRLEEEPPTHDARWRIVGFRRWTTIVYGGPSRLPRPAPTD